MGKANSEVVLVCSKAWMFELDNPFSVITAVISFEICVDKLSIELVTGIATTEAFIVTEAG